MHLHEQRQQSHTPHRRATTLTTHSSANCRAARVVRRLKPANAAATRRCRLAKASRSVVVPRVARARPPRRVRCRHCARSCNPPMLIAVATVACGCLHWCVPCVMFKYVLIVLVCCFTFSFVLFLICVCLENKQKHKGRGRELSAGVVGITERLLAELCATVNPLIAREYLLVIERVTLWLRSSMQHTPLSPSDTDTNTNHNSNNSNNSNNDPSSLKHGLQSLLNIVNSRFLAFIKARRRLRRRSHARQPGDIQNAILILDVVVRILLCFCCWFFFFESQNFIFHSYYTVEFN